MERAEIIWAVVGIVLILAEFLVPGLVVVFLGMSALLVAIGIYLGWLVGWMNIMVFWFISSIFDYDPSGAICTFRARKYRATQCR